MLRLAAFGQPNCPNHFYFFGNERFSSNLHRLLLMRAIYFRDCVQWREFFSADADISRRVHRFFIYSSSGICFFVHRQRHHDRTVKITKLPIRTLKSKLLVQCAHFKLWQFALHVDSMTKAENFILHKDTNIFNDFDLTNIFFYRITWVVF